MAGTRLVPTNRLPMMANEECFWKCDSSAKYRGEEKTLENPILEKAYFPYFLETKYAAWSQTIAAAITDAKMGNASKYPCAAKAPAATTSAVAGIGKPNAAKETTPKRRAYFQTRREERRKSSMAICRWRFAIRIRAAEVLREIFRGQARAFWRISQWGRSDILDRLFQAIPRGTLREA